MLRLDFVPIYVTMTVLTNSNEFVELISIKLGYWRIINEDRYWRIYEEPPIIYDDIDDIPF